MQSVEEFRKNFDSVYYSEILPALEFHRVEEDRKDTIAGCIVWFFFGIFLFIISFGITHVFSSYNLVTNLLSGVIGLLGVVLILGSIPWFVMPFESHIKSLIMPILLKNIPLFKWSSLNITSLGYKICKLIRASKLVSRFNEVNADECFQGVYKNVAIDINELKLNLVGIGLPFPVVKFNGVIVKLIPPRKYKGLTLIKKKKIINMSPKALKYVNLEDLEFEKEYNVYSNDQIEARYVLTTAFMERFKNIKLAFRASKIEASISEQGILIAISTNRDLFKVGKLWRPVADYEQFKTMMEEFSSILELIDTLKLEQNIGM